MANAITGVRIFCAFSLIFCPAFSGCFTLFYIFGGVSDVLDGMIARLFGTETERGARLDTMADIIFTVVVLTKIWKAVYLPLWLVIWIGVIVGIKGVNVISGLAIRKHFVSEHTLLNKITGILLFAIPLCIGHFPWQPVAVLVVLTCVTAMVAAIQEGYYIRTNREIY